MATSELDYSGTAGSNTDINGISVAEGIPPANLNNAIRAVAKLRHDATTRHVAKAAGAYTAVKADHNQFWRCTGAVTVNLTAAATLGDAWCLWVKADGGDVSIDPAGSETINGGSATLAMADGETALVICDGTGFYTVLSTFNSAVSGALVVDGITFPATQAASSNVNTLDDYEEGAGTITPALGFGGGSTGITYTSRAGSYVKIGKLVFVTLSFILTSKGSSSGSAVVTSALPYAPASVVQVFNVQYANMTLTPATYMLAQTGGGSSTTLYFTIASNTSNAEVATDSHFANNSQITVTGTYMAAA